jgi:acyl-CoA synthetase (AMP-forming)/AMP-acid ligase II
MRGGRYTYSEIEGLAKSLAHTLTACGVKQGDRVIIILQNSLNK